MKKILASILVLLCLSVSLKSQSHTLYFMEDIPVRTKLNPAFFPNKSWHLLMPILPNFYLGAGNNAFTIKKIIFQKDNKWTTAFSNTQNPDNFYKSIPRSTTIDARFEYDILSFGFRIFKYNYLTFDLSLKADAYASLPKDFFRLALYGTGHSDNFDFKNLGLNASLYGELGVGYTRLINDKWSFGLKAKGLLGFMGIHSKIDKLSLYASKEEWLLSGKGDIYVMTPLTKYDASSNSFLSGSLNEVLKPQGIGGAIDLGVTFKPIKNLTLSASVTDLGFIRWNKKADILDLGVTGNFSFKGIEYNPTKPDSTSMMEKILKELKDSISFTKTQGVTKNIDQWLTTSIYLGAEYGVLKDKISFTALYNASVNKYYSQHKLVLGVNLRPIKQIKTYFNYTFFDGGSQRLGVGINMNLGSVNMFLISDFVPLSFLKISNAEFIKDEAGRKMVEKIQLPYTTNSFNIQAGFMFSFGKKAEQKEPEPKKVKPKKEPKAKKEDKANDENINI